MPPSPPSLLLLLFLSPLLTASIKVHWLLTPGSVEDDGGFHQMAKETLMLLSNDPLVNAYDEFEFVSAVYPGDFPESGPDLTYIDTVLAVGEGAAPGTDVFMLMGFDFDKLVGMAGEKYPDYYFIQVDSCPFATKDSLPNVVCVLFQEDQVAFAAGVAAATASKTGAIGGIFGTPLGPLLRFENGFKAGARHAVPTITVETQFIHDFAALDKGAAVAEFMHVERNVDVIFGAAGGTSIGALNWCLDNEVLAIGVDADQFTSVYNGNTSAHPNLSYLLTSAQKAVDVATERVLREFVANGNLEAAGAKYQYTFDYSNGGVRLADCHLACGHLSLDEWEMISGTESKLAVQQITTGVTAGDVLDLYSPAANPLFSWVAADSFAEPPTERYNAASCSLTDPYHGTEVLLVFGGTDEDGNSEGDLWEYTVYGESWRTHTAANGLNSGGFLLKGADGFSVPTARSGAAMAPVTVSSYGCCGDSGSVFMWGGWEQEQGYLADGWVFTRDMSWFPAASQWTLLPTVASAPSARRYHAMAGTAGSNSTFMFGGEDEETILVDFWIHELASGLDGNATSHAWTKLAAPEGIEGSSGRRGSSLIAHGSHVFLFGGENFQGELFSDFYVYDTASAVWTKLENCPAALSFANLAVVSLEYRGESIFVVGGGGLNNAPNQQVYVYHIASDTWSLSSQEAMSSSSDCGAPSSEVAEEETSTHVKYATKAAGTATSSGLLVQFGGIAGSSVSGDVSIFVTGDRKCAELDSSFLFGASSGDSSFVLGAGGSAAARDLTNFNEGSCTNAAKFEKIWYWIGHEDGSSPSCVVGRGDDDYKLPTSSMQIDCDHVPATSGAATLCQAITLIGAVGCLACLLMMFVHRSKPIFKMSQFNFLVMSVLGALCMCLSNLTQYGANTEISCMSRIFAYNISFTLMFAPLFAKTYRIYKLLHNAALKRVKVSEGVITSLIMLIVALEIGLMVVWAAVDPLKGVRNEEKNNEYMLDSAVGKDYEWVECAYESGGGTVGLLNVVWKAIIIGYGCHISWGTRNYDLYIAEGKYIMVAMYQMALLAVIAGSVMIMGVSPVVAATVQCFASVVGSMSLVCLVVVPKLFMVGMTRENLMERTVSSATGGAATTAAGSGNTEEMAGLTGEIKDLKEEIRRLKGE